MTGVPCAGFDAGDGQNYVNIPLSGTTQILGLEDRSNCRVPGKYVYRISHAEIEPGTKSV